MEKKNKSLDKRAGNGYTITKQSLCAPYDGRRSGAIRPFNTRKGRLK